MDIDAEELRLTAYHLLVAKYIQVSGLGILLYDHFITFDIELEKIWKRRVSLGSALFLVNRYGTPLQYVAIINAFHDPRWTKEVSALHPPLEIGINDIPFTQLCDKYSVFEGASSVAMVGSAYIIIPSTISVPVWITT
ncbi:hypothetical protein CC2G_011097 [Coprinopsis cinerea AmutBmut pab1-1]|nr:hypothetical protein CC2G_011097 [Coprinopsis cinerea AmutBmut pab1-1]